MDVYESILSSSLIVEPHVLKFRAKGVNKQLINHGTQESMNHFIVTEFAQGGSLQDLICQYAPLKER